MPMDAVSTLNKPSILQRPAIYTDYYELTMAQGYFLSARKDERASFACFVRVTPYGDGYVSFAGLSDRISILNNLHFNKEQLHYLRQQGFQKHFLAYLRNLGLSVNVHAVREGEVVFPTTPLLRVEGNI